MPIYFSSKLKSVCRVKEVKDSLFKVYNVVFLRWRMSAFTPKIANIKNPTLKTK